ncbi:MAG: calcium-binding protein [Jannaschia sp.]
MTTANDLARVTVPFADDIDLVADISGYASFAFNGLRQITTTPRIVAGTLDGIADPLTIPKAVLDPLKLVPYGVGAAIKKFDQITGRTVDQIAARADTAWDWDEKLTPFNNVFEPFELWFGRANTIINGPAEAATGVIQIELGLDAIVSQQRVEALRIVEALGDLDLDGTKLAGLIDDRVDALAGWDPDLLAELDAGIQAMTAAVGQVSGSLPDLTALEDAGDVIGAAFGPIKDATNYLDGILNQNYTVVPAVSIPAVVTPGFWIPAIWPFPRTWVPPVTITPAINTPAVTVNPADIMATIGNAIGIVQDFVENLVLDALSAVGINLFGAIDALEAKMLAPLNPLFSAINSLDAIIDGVVTTLTGLVDKFLDGYGEMIQFLENLQGRASLFDWSTVGEAEDDTLTVINDRIDAIYGMDGDDVLRGGTGDFLFGGLGDDTLEGVGEQELYGGAGADLLTAAASLGTRMMGGSDIDKLWAREGDDTLDGGEGADLMIGGQGSDLYYVDDAGDVVVESRKWSGDDKVVSSVDFRTGRQHIEEVELVGEARIAMGNGLAQVLIGNAGNNILDGRKQNDTMIGGEGNDTYLVRAPGDLVVEAVDEGVDSVRAFRSYALTENVERLYLLDVRDSDGIGVNMNAIGNDLDNLIFGNAFENLLIGREGNDVLRGFEGADTFVFDRALGADNVDRILDFNATETSEGDALKLKGSIFTGLAKGVLDAEVFVAGSEAQDAADRIIFDRASGQMWFDQDGTGSAQKELFATFDQNALVTAADIEVF